MNKKYSNIFNTVISFANSTWREILRCDLQTTRCYEGVEYVFAYVVFDDKSEWTFNQDGSFERRSEE